MKILFVLDAKFPYGEAYSSRARNFIKLFLECGHEVHVMASLTGEKIVDKKYTCENIDIFTNAFSLLGIGTGISVKKTIKKFLKNNKVDIIISNSIPYVTSKILKIARKHKIPYIVEQCEWYDSSTFKFGKYNPYYRECMKMIEHKNKKLNGIIAISRLFEEHYLAQNKQVIRIPTILDMKDIEPRYKRKDNKVLNIVFAGSLGKGKENIYPMLKAVEIINKIEERIHLHFYGPTKEQLVENVENRINVLKNYVHIYGKIPQNEVEGKVRNADFTFIIRPNRRSSNAGFPTKLAESMAVGTPVIANNTGDIGIYVSNKKNGFLLHGNLDEQLVKCLQYILEMTENELEDMRKNARKTFEENFDYRNYVDAMQNFIRRVK